MIPAPGSADATTPKVDGRIFWPQKLAGQSADVYKRQEKSKEYAQQYKDIPLVGRTIFDQQSLLYQALLEWLDSFSAQFSKEDNAL